MVGALNDDDVKRLKKAFINALQSIGVPGGAVNLSDILLTYKDHKSKHSSNLSFESMEVPLQAYDDSIANNTNNAVRAKAERLWIPKIELQCLIKTVKRAGRAFLVADVGDTWFLPLKEESTFYNKVPLRDFFAFLKGGSGGLESTNIVSLLCTTLGRWADDPHVPEYVNHLEDAQKKSVRVKLLIDNKWLAAIATGSLLAAGSFLKQHPDWDSLPQANKTWAAWKTTFRAHQFTLEREQRATGERGGVFGSAAAAVSIHGITAATATPGALITPDALAFHTASETSTTPAGDFALQALNGHLDRMADAATNSGITLSQLTDTNARLAATTSTQYQNIKKLLTDIKLSSTSPNPRSSGTGAGTGATGDQQTIKLIQAAIKIAGSSAGSAPPTDGE